MSNFPGLATTAGAYSMTRRFSGVTKAGWTELDIRGPGWVQACPELNDVQKADATARAELRAVLVTVESGTFDLAGEEVPGDRFSRADGAGTFTNTSKDFSPGLGVSSFWWKASAADFEIEIRFDIPRAEDV